MTDYFHSASSAFIIPFSFIPFYWLLLRKSHKPLHEFRSYDLSSFSLDRLFFRRITFFPGMCACHSKIIVNDFPLVTGLSRNKFPSSCASGLGFILSNSSLTQIPIPKNVSLCCHRRGLLSLTWSNKYISGLFFKQKKSGLEMNKISRGFINKLSIKFEGL